MTPKQIRVLKTKSLAKWRKIASEGNAYDTPLSPEDCGYCLIAGYNAMANKGCSCCQCALRFAHLCEGGKGLAFQVVFHHKMGIDTPQRVVKTAAEIMVAAIERDIARDEKERKSIKP